MPVVPITLGGAGDSAPNIDPLTGGPGDDISQWRNWIMMQLAQQQNHPPPPTPPAPLGGPGAGLGAPNYTNPMLAAGVGPGAGLNAGTTTPATAAASPYATAMPWRGPIADRPAAPAAAAPSRFVQIERPNIDMAGSLRRTGGGPLMMSALDLSGLFRRAS